MTSAFQVTTSSPSGFSFFSLSARHTTVVAIVPHQLFPFVRDMGRERCDPIQDGEDGKVFLEDGFILSGRERFWYPPGRSFYPERRESRGCTELGFLVHAPRHFGSSPDCGY
jgi:hypothetical protein